MCRQFCYAAVGAQTRWINWSLIGSFAPLPVPPSDEGGGFAARRRRRERQLPLSQKSEIFASSPDKGSLRALPRQYNYLTNWNLSNKSYKTTQKQRYMVVFRLFCSLPYVVSLDSSLMRKNKGNFFMLNLPLGRASGQKIASFPGLRGHRYSW